MTPHVLVVDDDTLYAESLSAVLEQDGRLDVVGQAADGREAVELAYSLLPDVVVMDIHMPVMDLRKGVGTDALVEAALAAGLETVTR
jgi:two-component system, chemotaxis family, protein-glutamate methylesterase/glutaminase